MAALMSFLKVGLSVFSKEEVGLWQYNGLASLSPKFFSFAFSNPVYREHDPTAVVRPTVVHLT